MDEYMAGYWGYSGDTCYRHDWVATGTLKSWCKKCNIDGEYNRSKQCFVPLGEGETPHFKEEPK